MPTLLQRCIRLFAIMLSATTIARKYAVATLFPVAISFGLLPASSCFAGGGPENVFLLVNARSQDSLIVANEYVRLRKIPPMNVLYLDYRDAMSIVSVDIFRKKILLPALTTIQQRKLTSQIDYLVYSCDFPWRIVLSADFPNEKFPPQFAPHGSLTGLTYLKDFVIKKRKEVLSLNTNWYFMESTQGLTISRAFRSRYRWAHGGRRTATQGLSYMISATLGVSKARGNQVDEIISSLRLAKKADGTKPTGTVYFMKHDGPRSKPRDGLYDAAAAELRSLGVAAKVLKGKFPRSKPSIAGLTCGIVDTDLGRAGCRFLPGAFCDNLTSAGASFGYPKRRGAIKQGKQRVGQIITADFIRYGATAASGTVFEPLAIRQKFPLPSVHVHYANGCSLGEAFYQSVSGPYQQFLVGDPLCQPWAEIPVVKIDKISSGKVLRGLVEITPRVVQHKKSIREFELYVDGLRIQTCKPGQTLFLDTTTLQDGHHELRVVARDDTPIETQGRLITEVIFKNGRDAIGLTTKRQQLSASAKHVTIDVTTTTKTSVVLFCNSRKLGNLPTGSGSLKIATDRLGAGQVEVYAVSEKLRSKPLLLDINP